MKLIAWSSIEEDIVRTSKNRSDAHKQLKAEGFKRTENSVWAKYRKMKRVVRVRDMVQYDTKKGQFVLKGKTKPINLCPFHWKEDPRPSIFLTDTHFRTRNSAGTLMDKNGIDYKSFGVYTRAKEKPQPNKHEGFLSHAKTKTTGAAKAKADAPVGQRVDEVQGSGWSRMVAQGVGNKTPKLL